MGKLSAFLLICFIFTFGYGIGLINFITDFEDKCEMTYIYEYPQFVRVSHHLDEKFPKYALFAYSEGRFTSEVRNMHFTGIPVLFIPGNAGSHKQVRSLSSIALRKMLSNGIPYHFDYFTLDLNGELSGVYGPLLFDQLEYVNSSLYRILDLYKGNDNKPESVVLIGHSMGGVIAVKLACQISNPSLISVLITLASPLSRPPIFLDYHTKKFYDEGLIAPEETSLISLSGGYNDFLIPSFLNNLKSSKSLYAVTTTIPRAWVEANHVQILWCKQVVLTITRALFDIVSVKKKQISNSTTYRDKVFHHHLIDNSGINIRYWNSYEALVHINHKGQWIENIQKQYSVKHLQGVREAHWYMVKMNSLPGYEMVSVLAINLETVDWVFVCNAYVPKGPSKVCVEGYHLTQYSHMAPSVKYKRRYLQMNMYELRRNYSEATHIVFRVLPTNEPIIFHVDTYDNNERNISVELPKWWSFENRVIIHNTAENAVHYNLILPQLEHIIQYYQLYIHPTYCSKDYHHASASLIVPWSHETYHSYVTNVDKKPANIRLYSSKPAYAKDLSAYIRIILEPSCSYRISIRPSISGSLGQLARVYSPLLLTNVAVIILMSLRHQLRCLENNVHCSILFVALEEGAKPYFVLTITKMLLQVSKMLLPSYAPQPDMFYLINEGTDFFWLPLVLYLCSVGIVFLMGIGLAVSLVALESTVHKSALKLLARSISFNVSWSDYLMTGLHKVPLIVVVTLILLCLSTCGSLALCLGCLFYFLRLTQMSQDYVEEVVWHFAKNIARQIKNKLFRQKENACDGAIKTPLRITDPNVDEDKQENDKQLSIQQSVEQSVKTEATKVSETVNKNTETDDEHNTVEKDEAEQAAENNIENKNKSDNDEEVSETECNKDDFIVDHGESCNKEKFSDRDKQVVLKNEEDLQVAVGGTKDTENDNDRNRNKEKEGKLLAGYSAIFFHSTIFLLWLIIALINIPAVMTWARNFQFNKTLTPDDSFIPGIVLSACAFPLWQFELPNSNRSLIANVLSIFQRPKWRISYGVLFCKTMF
ncbi:unnamed protein product [Acanthoscelides obtectus]|uniref:GPI inositol-deacylase n=1 Tax=Acanthoscelides obtectus TaxID=200917 RepID=A0A9P0LKG7_ACAOB|nr:unnamed protein product [Acanthoscelides obtectus]CAK1668254.1 GPI inositol-deacylase [Acanthoscelides obtectus]